MQIGPRNWKFQLRRGVWFWAATGTVLSVLTLWAATQLAIWQGQSVTWYTGFGQWLGALGSLIAAGVALWIATTDRRRSDQRREADLAQREADLTREAGLVQIDAGAYKSSAGIRIRNRRSSRIFDIKVTKFVLNGTEVAQLDLYSIDMFPKSEGARYYPADLPHFAIEVDQEMYLYPNGIPNMPAGYVRVEYTDSSGRRWQVDTDRAVERL
ncbi:hypothetical protein [Mycolicibacter minnesotensis]